MINIKFQCTGRNESLNGEQKVVQVTFSPGTGVFPTVATFAPGAAIGTPGAPQQQPSVPESSVQYNASAFTATFTGNIEEASQFVVGEVYEFTLGNAVNKKAEK